jgi:hypothetical protein
MRSSLYALLACLVLPRAFAAAVAPENPYAFETVNLRMTVDSCAFDPGAVAVTMRGSHITIAARRNACLVAGVPTVVDIMLGAFPAGSYTVSVHDNPNNFAPPYERAAFEVIDLPTARHTDISGMWWNDRESGWGLSLFQGPTGTLFGAWFIYGSSGQPEWYTLQGGQWLPDGRWTSPVYRTSGPYFGASSFDPRSVTIDPVGSATLEPQGGGALFTYSIPEVTSTKAITRMAF